jgi:hypothetical protein
MSSECRLAIKTKEAKYRGRRSRRWLRDPILRPFVELLM